MIEGGNMKIIKVDNFGCESVSDILIAENVHKAYAKDIELALNANFSGSCSPDYFRSVDDDYTLFIPDF